MKVKYSGGANTFKFQSGKKSVAVKRGEVADVPDDVIAYALRVSGVRHVFFTEDGKRVQMSDLPKTSQERVASAAASRETVVEKAGQADS